MNKLFCFCRENDQYGIGLENEEGRFDFSNALEMFQRAKGNKEPISFTFLQILVDLGYCNAATIRSIIEDPWVQSKKKQLSLEGEIIFDLPIARPSKIVCLGRNYEAHAKEMKHAVPDEPIIFSKAPSTLIPHDADIIIPRWLEGRVDHEAELAIIIGKPAKDITPDDAMDYIAGYSILNDITARTIQKSDIEKKQPWFRSKSLDTFCPMGPYLIPSYEVANPNELQIRLTVNGEERQTGNTASMIFKIPEIIASISRYMTLLPGDVIATGTPEGVSPIQEGDVIEVTITDFGTLRNRVVVAG